MEETRELKEVVSDRVITQRNETFQKVILSDSVALKVAEPDNPVKKTAPNKTVGKSVKADSQTPARKPD